MQHSQCFPAGICSLFVMCNAVHRRYCTQAGGGDDAKECVYMDAKSMTPSGNVRNTLLIPTFVEYIEQKRTCENGVCAFHTVSQGDRFVAGRRPDLLAPAFRNFLSSMVEEMGTISIVRRAVLFQVCSANSG